MLNIRKVGFFLVATPILKLLNGGCFNPPWVKLDHTNAVAIFEELDNEMKHRRETTKRKKIVRWDLGGIINSGWVLEKIGKPTSR